ncbi:universal bacterial protein YeaZ [Sulfobacillus acidophilus TPY]|uniref:Universal protein YeaZ n=1 Tax=Sulfobacillus acidophilus (strain ATCC 700253 / DSM 10332 / NAL) TaxID=679936 RepID=G8TXV2_SULAD|nr:universal bacterial protein YeaZ [Sulfobacillus acidophilus TPY]AEW06158.1 universal protein YeaZ [Sulfobacillus acidophilus DSM 10332]
MGYKVLGWDASGPSLSVGLIDDGRVVADITWARPRLAGTHLVSWIDQLVREFGRPDGLAVGVGPGSFTGVRVAVTAAKAYAAIWGVPVKGVSSLAAWARGVAPPAYVVVTSERRGSAFYLGYYWVGPSGPEPLIPDTAINGALPEGFPLTREVVVLGPAAEDAQWLSRIGRQARPGQAILSGGQVALTAWPAVQWGESDDPLTLAPAYLRPPAASV